MRDSKHSRRCGRVGWFIKRERHSLDLTAKDRTMLTQVIPDMAYVNCNLCGADDFTVVFPKGYAQLHRIVRCKRCNLMYANPQELIDCVEYSKQDDIPFGDPSFERYLTKQRVQLPDNLRVLAKLNRLAPRKGKLLEVGSFLGNFATEIRASGWDVTCLEPYVGAVKYSREKHGLKVIEGVLPQPDLPDASFDAVILLHVIEHMPDPGANIAELRRLLKPGGMLVVETPRFDSLMFKLLGRRERSLSITNGHIYFFTVPTLTKLLEKHGFETVSVDLVGRTLTADRFLGNIGVILRNSRVRAWLQKTSEALKLDKLVLHVNVRDMQRIYCRAKAPV
jgi:2-polyprenyl-3-methyl-5-hydroxy-6-metoxy-1,4-benzoquinol methylase